MIASTTRILLLFFASLAVVASTPIDLEPKIAPGYEPVDKKVEQSLWSELEEYEAAVRRSALLVRDESINEYVRSTTCRVTGEYCADLRVYVIRNPGFNASMTANGMVQVWTGLLVRVSSEDELAAVIGHELAHYTQLHTLERWRRINSSLTSSTIIDLVIGLPLASMAAAADIMSFSQDQETQADLLGVKFMADSGYDPGAATRVWEMLVAEEENAAVKRRKPNLFTKTHPSSEQRVATLSRFVEEHYGHSPEIDPRLDRHIAILNEYYMLLMEDQIDTNRFGRTEAILKRHREIGVNPGLIDFFHGEMFRQRNGDGDLERAREAYEKATLAENPSPLAFRNLGYVHLKQRDNTRASANFHRYLELKPDADDRAMIEFYLEE